MQKIVSSKFAAKIETVDRLSQLPDKVPIENIDIPDEVLKHDKALNPQEEEHKVKDGTLTSKSVEGNKKRAKRRNEKLFGKDLSVVTDGIPETPSPIHSLISYLSQNALDDEGLFRKSPSSAEVKSLKDRLDRDLEVQWSQYDVPTLAGLLKAYVRELPAPLIPPPTYINLPGILQIQGRMALCQYIQQSFLDSLEEQSLGLLKEIIGLLKDTLQHAARNRMSMKSLTTVWAPNLIRHESAEEELRRLDASKKLIEYLIEYYDDLF